MTQYNRQKNINFRIGNEVSGIRLDKFLIMKKNLIGEKFKNFSRNQLQNLIKSGAIKINGLIKSPHYLLKEKDTLTFYDLATTQAAKHADTYKNLSDKPLVIIAQTPDYLIVNKPAGLIVYGQNAKAVTLVDLLLKLYPFIENIGDDPSRPGIVHRLDKDVSGLMVIAKSQASFDDLKKQFQQRTIQKGYTGLVYGRIGQPSAIINFPIKRGKRGYKMAALPLISGGSEIQMGKTAETQLQVIKKFINYTLLKIKIRSGRTHQIRVHLYAYNHPLVGDNIYATAKTRLANKKLGSSRIFLMADKLCFADLTGKKQIFRLDLPNELKKILSQIK